MGQFETKLYAALVGGGFVVAAIVFLSLFFITAPYGRHMRPGWGPAVNSTVGWMIMESVAVSVLPLFFFLGHGLAPTPAWVFLILWETHYLHRAIVYPLRRRSRKGSMPLAIILMAIVFNIFNGYVNGRYLGLNTDVYGADWLMKPCLVSGVIVFFAGFAINIHSDNVLRSLGWSGKARYRIPRGGLYRWVSCPNYLGEVMEWTGWALATWSVSGLLFAVWTGANLIPRAFSHHRWYLNEFPDYPPKRKAIFPFLF